jgi:hypothetical protein
LRSRNWSTRPVFLSAGFVLQLQITFAEGTGGFIPLNMGAKFRAFRPGPLLPIEKSRQIQLEYWAICQNSAAKSKISQAVATIDPPFLAYYFQYMDTL